MQNDPFLVKDKLKRFSDILIELFTLGCFDLYTIVDKPILYYQHGGSSLFRPRKVQIGKDEKGYLIYVNGTHVYSLTYSEFEDVYLQTLYQFKKYNPSVCF